MRLDPIDVEELGGLGVETDGCKVIEAWMTDVTPESHDAARVAQWLMKDATARDQLQDMAFMEQVLGIAIMSLADSGLPWWFSKIRWALPQRVRVYLLYVDGCEQNGNEPTFELWIQIETGETSDPITMISEIKAEGMDIKALANDINLNRTIPFTNFEMLG